MDLNVLCESSSSGCQLNKDGEFESLESIPSPKDRAEGKIQGELILYEGR